jgi:hypothetical protein
MEDHVATRHRGPETGGLGHVAAHHLGFDAREVAEVARRACKHPHAVPFRGQPRAQMRAHEAMAARHERQHA